MIEFRFNDGTKIKFGPCSIPGRKSKALCRQRGPMVDVLAYFRNDNCAAAFDRLLDLLERKINEAGITGGVSE